MLPLLPLMGVFLIGSGVGWFVRAQAEAPVPIVWDERGWSARVEPSGDGAAWSWTVTKEGFTPGNGTAISSAAAMDKARQWVSSRMLPRPPKTHTPPLPTPTPLPVEPGTPGSLGTPSAPVATPLPGIAATPPLPMPPQPVVDIEGEGAQWLAAQNQVVVTDLARFVAAAFGSSNPWDAPPSIVVRRAIKSAIPDLDWDAVSPGLTIVAADGSLQTLDEVAANIAELQAQLSDPELPDEAIPFAEDILSEAIFDVEQQQSVSPFAYRGRVLYARQVANGDYIATIVDAAGDVQNGEDLVPTGADALELGRQEIDEQDGFA